MKYLIPVLVGAATITVAVTTGLAQAKGALTWHDMWKPPFVYGYGAAGVLLLIAITIVMNTARNENTSAAAKKHREFLGRLADLMTRHREIYTSLRTVPNNNEFPELIRKADEWVNDLTALLRDAGQPTDAETIVQVSHMELTPEHLSRFAHVPEWKRDVIARFLLFYQTLEQIKATRRW